MFFCCLVCAGQISTLSFTVRHGVTQARQGAELHEQVRLRLLIGQRTGKICAFGLHNVVHIPQIKGHHSSTAPIKNAVLNNVFLIDFNCSKLLISIEADGPKLYVLTSWPRKQDVANSVNEMSVLFTLTF